MLPVNLRVSLPAIPGCVARCRSGTRSIASLRARGATNSGRYERGGECGLFQTWEALLCAGCVECLPAVWFLLHQFGELGWRAGQARRRLFEIEFTEVDDIQRFRQDRGKVGVVGVHCHTLVPAARPPQRAGLPCIAQRQTDAQGQFDTQAEDGDRVILRLAAALAGLRTDPARPMHEHDGCLDFVAMLAPGAGATRPVDFAVSQQPFDRQRRGVRS